MSVKIEEKIELLKELGMNGAAREIEKEVQKKLLVAKFSGMKFKITNTENVRKQICSGIHLSNNLRRLFFQLFVLALLMTSSVLILANKNVSTENSLTGWGILFILFIVGSIAVGIVTIIHCFSDGENFHFHPDLRRMELSNWRDGIPYGALLAVKEAKESGIGNFEILFPASHQRVVRLKSDPVIIGFKEGIMFEVFAWDDRKVYE